MGNMLDCPDGWSQKSDSSRYCWKLKKNAPGPRPDAKGLVQHSFFDKIHYWWMISKNLMSWTSKANCERDGAHLATIYSEHDDAMVKNLMLTGEKVSKSIRQKLIFVV